MSRIILASAPLFLFSLIFPFMEKNGNPDHAIQHDGPYVWYDNGKVHVRYITDSAGVKSVKTESVDESGKENLVLKVATDSAGQTFDVKLKRKIQKEKSEYKKPSK